ncbi:MAG TPA: polymer-forming cytoskeletal protein [Candidatus Saccharimonadales bacterium]|nr:polymer-forming cytoskeletal protein [Candidatus Saccharimonadales bacterium]
MADDKGTEGESLENAPGGNVVPVGGGTMSTPTGDDKKSKKKGGKFGPKAILGKFNIYLLIFLIIMAIIIAGSVFLYLQANKQTTKSQSKAPTQDLSASALQQLASQGTTIGDAKHVLNIESNSVFQGTVLVRGNLQVAGTVQIGSTLALTGLTVSGQTSLGTLQSKDLTVGGKAAIQGQLTAASLSIAGGGSFNGAVTAPVLVTNSLSLNGNLAISHHIDTGGGVPGSSRGSALGSAGTATLSGSDTAGSISIHTGNNPAAGCFITVSFNNTFGNTPHVVISPVGQGAATLQYYVNRSSSEFSICTANAPSSSATFGFDYVVLD